MTNDEYLHMKKKVMEAAKLLEGLDLFGMLRRASCAEALDETPESPMFLRIMAASVTLQEMAKRNGG